MTDTNERTETSSFKYANRRIEDLVGKLKHKGVCQCCASRALMYHAAFLSEAAMGSAEAIEMMEGIIEALREHNVPAPDRATSH